MTAIPSPPGMAQLDSHLFGYNDDSISCKKTYFKEAGTEGLWVFCCVYGHCW